MTKRTRLSLQRLEARDVPSGNRLFALSQDVGGQVAVYESKGATDIPNVTDPSTSSYRPIYGGTGRLLRTIQPFDANFKGAVHVAIGDVTGDGVEDVVTAAGSGNSARIRVYDGQALLNGTVSVVRDFFAFDSQFKCGAYVAVGQIDPSTVGQEIIVGADIGGGAHVRVFGLTANSVINTHNFFAFGGGFTGGVRVAATDANGDGRAEVIAAAGPGGGPHVRMFHLTGPTPTILDQFFVYQSSFRGGVYVAAGELNGDGTRPEIVFGAGEGGGPHVKAYTTQFDGRMNLLNEFFAGDARNSSGARVGIANLGKLADRQSLYVGEGANAAFSAPDNRPDPRLRSYNFQSVPDNPIILAFSSDAIPITNPVVPNVDRFVGHVVFFEDTFQFSRQGGLFING